MKTRLFYTTCESRDNALSFLRDSKVLLSLSDEIRGELLGMVAELEAEAITGRQWVEKLEALASKHRIPVVDVTSAMQVLRFLTGQLTNENYKDDSTEDLADDFTWAAREYGVPLESEHKDLFRDTLKELRLRVIPKYEKIKRRRSAANGVLPSISSFGTTVEVRAVVENRFHIGMKAAQYEPKIVDFVPVASVSLGVDSGPIERFCFQLSEEELDALIEELRSAQVCLQKLKERWPCPTSEPDSSKTNTGEE